MAPAASIARRPCAESMMARIVTLATAPAILVLMFVTKAGSHDPVASASWNRDVEPIVRARCFACHRPDGPAHPTLASAEDFRTHRAAVKDAVISRRMPLWSAVRGFGAFERDPSLSPLQVSLIASWIEAGAPASSADAGAAILRQSPAPSVPGSGRRVTVHLPPFQSTTGVQRDVVTLPASGRIAVTGWRFVPGHPSIGHVSIRDARGRLLWTTSPEFESGAYPDGTGIVLNAPVQLTVESSGRPAADPSPHGNAIASQLEIDVSAKRVVELETVRVECGTRTRVTSTIYGLRPDISSATFLEARIDGEAPGVLGLFKGPTSQRLTYWLRTPLRLRAKDMLTVPGKECTLDVVVGPRS
jgi:hypothetical protein